MDTTNLYKGFDFQILGSGEFKEDAVREALISPILSQLGYKAYGHNRIVYSKTLWEIYIRIGTTKQKIDIAPDYLLEINGKYRWVLDIYPLDEDFDSIGYIEQVYSYAIHNKVQVDIFAVSNGKEFKIYSTNEKKLLLDIQLVEIDKHWKQIEQLLSPDNW